jgi:phosphoenolpyruvate carboxykinase (GTP)
MVIKKNINDTINMWINILKPSNVEWVLDNDIHYYINKIKSRCNESVVDITARDNCYAFFSNPTDVARMESRTFICSSSCVGYTNNAWDPDKCFTEMISHMTNVMVGRTMYIIPFCLGTIGNKYAKYGIQITDSEYACINMQIMCRTGKAVMDASNEYDTFIPCIHTVGECDFQNTKWPCSDMKYICHFTDNSPFVLSYGSGYGGNAILSKKCYALRIASILGKREGWLAEHCLLLKITSPPPLSEVKYILASFPSACGKTNLAMVTPCKELYEEGWKFETLGDDIVWMHSINGQLYAQSVENGFFGVAPGTNAHSNPNAIASLSKNCLFTNCATYINEEGKTDVWWEGLTSTPPLHFTNWKGECNVLPAAHSNARYTCPIVNCPVIAPNYNALVPIHAIIFGGRRRSCIPLVSKARDIYQGIFYGATLSSEETSANSEAKLGNIRFDPMSMRPFIGYNICEYFQHWIDFMTKLNVPPQFYLVNWFRKDENNKFIWDGFSENSKILKWIFLQTQQTQQTQENKSSIVSLSSAFGDHPSLLDLYLDETNDDHIHKWQQLFSCKIEELMDFKKRVNEFFNDLETNSPVTIPNELKTQLNNLVN